MSLSLETAVKALRTIDWDDLLNEGVGTRFAVLVDGEPVLGTVVESISKEDYYDDRVFTVTVEVAQQFFQKTGNCQNGSHCYGDYETSWNALTEVRPRETQVTVYEPV